MTDSQRLKDVVLKIYVEKKKPISKLTDAVKIPSSVRLAGLSGVIATDVEEIGKVKKESNTSPFMQWPCKRHPSRSLGH